MCFQNAIDGSSALYYAVRCSNPRLVYLLLEHGANRNMKTQPRLDSVTPLHIAVACGHFEEALMLIKKGADQSLKSLDGQTPIKMAQNMGRHAMVQLLSTNGDSGGRTLSRINLYTVPR